MKVKIKSRIKQFWCGHKEQTWMQKDEMLNSDTHHLICLRCGKELECRTFEYHGNSYK